MLIILSKDTILNTVTDGVYRFTPEQKRIAIFNSSGHVVTAPAKVTQRRWDEILWQCVNFQRPESSEASS